MAGTLDRLFLEQAREYLAHEYPAKLRASIAVLPPDKVWWRANEQSNSVGNLLLHLNGNMRQWMVAGVGGESFTRRRSAEFEAREGAGVEQLLTALERTLADVDGILNGLSAEQLGERRVIQGRELTVLDAIFHVTEHFAYHLGQIILIAKMFAPGGVRFYEDAGGLARPTWK